MIFKNNMKITNGLFQLLCVFILAGCQSVDSNSPSQAVTVDSTSTVLLTPFPTAVRSYTVTPIFLDEVITEENIRELALQKKWEVEPMSQWRDILWFSDSSQFIVPTNNMSVDGLQFFNNDETLSTRFFRTDSLIATVDSKDQVAIYSRGLHILNKEGEEIKAFRTTKICDEDTATHLAAVPGTDLIVSGHQTSLSDFGLNYNIEDKSRVLMWDLEKATCIELKKEFSGRLWSLSASADGRSVSFNYGVKDSTTGLWHSVVEIYDLILAKEVCSLEGLNARFNYQNQIVTYDTEYETISVFSATDCTLQTEFEIGKEPLALSFNSEGDILAVASEGLVSFWSLNKGGKLHEINLQTSLSSLPKISFSPNARYLAITQFMEIPSGKDEIMIWGIEAE